jgi:hypothetical protein
MIKEPVELSHEHLPNLSRSGILDRITPSRQIKYTPSERLNPADRFGNTVKSQPSSWRKMIHEITEAIALFLIIFMRWLDLMRADSNDLAIDRINNWFWEWLNREYSISNPK